jgi:hypothetical protein
MTLAQLSSWTSPNSTSIFVQPPGQAFVAFLLQNVPIPSPQRVRLDLSETETKTRTWTIPRNPVERLTAQNKIRNPDVLQVSGMLSANPLLSPLAAIGLARLDKIALLELKLILTSGIPTPVFVVTPDGKHPNMMCTSLVETYTEGVGNGVQLTMTFEEIQIVIPGLVTATLDLDALQLGAAASSSVGPTTPTEVVDPGGLG